MARLTQSAAAVCSSTTSKGVGVTPPGVDNAKTVSPSKAVCTGGQGPGEAVVGDAGELRAAGLVEPGIGRDDRERRRGPRAQRLRLGRLALPMGLHRNGIRLGQVHLARHEQVLGEQPAVGGEG